MFNAYMPLKRIGQVPTSNSSSHKVASVQVFGYPRTASEELSDQPGAQQLAPLANEIVF